MGIINRTVEQAIKKAIKLEIDGRAFFTQAAEVTGSERGKKMFLWLAQEEDKHLETFSQLFTKVLKSEEWKDMVSDAEAKHSGQSPLISRLEEKMASQKGKNELSAIEVGMDLERNAIAFFAEAASQSEDTTAAKIFLEISEEEKFHYDMLQAQFDSVANSGFWLGSSEFRMDGKW